MLNTSESECYDSYRYANTERFFFFKFFIFRVNGQPFATLTDAGTNLDIGKGLVADGILLVEKRRERKLAKLVNKFEFFLCILFLNERYK